MTTPITSATYATQQVVQTLMTTIDTMQKTSAIQGRRIDSLSAEVLNLYRWVQALIVALTVVAVLAVLT